ncbi:MAG: CoA ester lyase [Litoreibacter sp.]
MDLSVRPFRSVLYIPGDKPRAIEKARGLPVDAIIFDLEDAVAPQAKRAARDTLAAELSAGGFGDRYKIIRVNEGDTVWGDDDLAAAIAMAPDAILLPKVENAKTIADIEAAIPATTSIWAMMETPRAILNAPEIAAHPRLNGFVLGTNDLAKELHSTGRAAMVSSLQMCLLAARAEDIIAIDGVYNAFKDEAGLRVESIEGRDMGFDGKSLIHPAQVDVANAVYGPSQEVIELAKRQIAAFEQAEAEGKGIAIVDGKIVESLHVVTAHQTLAKAAAIVALEDV